MVEGVGRSTHEAGRRQELSPARSAAGERLDQANGEGGEPAIGATDRRQSENRTVELWDIGMRSSTSPSLDRPCCSGQSFLTNPRRRDLPTCSAARSKPLPPMTITAPTAATQPSLRPVWGSTV